MSPSSKLQSLPLRAHSGIRSRPGVSLCLGTELCLLMEDVATPSAKPDLTILCCKMGRGRAVHSRPFAHSLSALAQQPQMWGLSLLAMETQA